MKKGILVLVLFVIAAAGAFAQFGIGGSVTTNFTATTYPSIDIMYGLEKLDILGGLTFSNEKQTLTIETAGSTNSNSASDGYFGIFAGIAPKAQMSGNWSLSFPLLLGFTFGSLEIPGKSDFFGLAIEAGGRATYSLSGHWSLFTGFLINIFTYSSNKTTSGTKTTAEISTLFNTGLVQLGFIYKF